MVRVDDFVWEACSSWREACLRLAANATATAAVKDAARLLAAFLGGCGSFTVRDLAGLSADELRTLENPFALGVGSPHSRVVVMGTEAAYSPEVERRNYALENCALPLFAIGEAPCLAATVADEPSWRTVRGPFSVYPARYYWQTTAQGTGHTWQCLARVLRCHWRDLGEHCYQIERSTRPSPAQAAGQTVSARRAEFLKSFVRSTGASTLVLHGKLNDKAVEQLDRELAREFLGLDPSWCVINVPGARAPLHLAESPTRRVVRCRALNNDVEGRLIEELSALLG